ncbi:MAG TPA: hypothetical protein VHC72_02215, partial [Bryobacteraceae bacterium]|nr:hypothetical protein [Bryobacteraceae bacterium]
TNTYSAQFGGNGAVVNAITKSGTNALHGSAYEFLRNSVLDARNFFDAQKPPFRRNQFGGSLGGPIKKDKLFFFVNYEGLQQLLGESRVAFVPDASVRAGAAPNIAPTLALYPLPTTEIGGGIGTLVTSANELAHENYLLARGDWTISANNSLFMRYVSDRADFTQPFSGSTIPLWPELDLSRNQYGTVEDRWTLSPSMVNIARVSLVRPTESAAITNSLPQLDFFPGSGRENGTVAVSGLSTIGATTTLPFNLVQNRFTYADEMYWTHGAHTVAFGVSITRTQNNVFAPFEIGGTYTFNSLQDFLNGNAYTLVGALPSAGDATRDFRELLFAPYFNDQWKVLPNLTLNLGLRYQPTTNPVGVRHEVTALTDAPYGTGFVDVKNAFANNPSLGNWDPRVGFSWSPFKDNKTVVRGGFGIFHDLIVARAYVTAYVLSPPDTLGLQTHPPYPAAFSGGGAALPPSEVEAIDYQTKNTPYMMQYNFNIQRDLGQNTILTLGYVGSRGVHLFAMRDVNAPVPTIDPDGVYHFASVVDGALVSNPRVNPAFGEIASRAPVGDSNYNSFQLNLNRQLTKNLQAQISYAWAKSIDDNSISFGLEGGGAPQNFSNPFNAAYDRGRSSFDLTHSFRASSVYMLPLHGNQLLEGWQLSGIFSATSGFPFTAYTGFDQTGLLGGGTPRPNLNAGCVNPIIGQPGAWYNPACFSLQAPGTLGNLGRDSLVGPDLFDLDFAVMKDTAIRKISDQFHVQFRAEAFNLMNHPNFGLPNQNVFTQTTAGNGKINPQAGKITTTIPNNQREIQFAVKVVF